MPSNLLKSEFTLILEQILDSNDKIFMFLKKHKVTNFYFFRKYSFILAQYLQEDRRKFWFDRRVSKSFFKAKRKKFEDQRPRLIKLFQLLSLSAKFMRLKDKILVLFSKQRLGSKSLKLINEFLRTYEFIYKIYVACEKSGFFDSTMPMNMKLRLIKYFWSHQRSFKFRLPVWQKVFGSNFFESRRFGYSVLSLKSIDNLFFWHARSTKKLRIPDTNIRGKKLLAFFNQYYPWINLHYKKLKFNFVKFRNNFKLHKRLFLVFSKLCFLYTDLNVSLIGNSYLISFQNLLHLSLYKCNIISLTYKILFSGTNKILDDFLSKDLKMVSLIKSNNIKFAFNFGWFFLIIMNFWKNFLIPESIHDIQQYCLWFVLNVNYFGLPRSRYRCLVWNQLTFIYFIFLYKNVWWFNFKVKEALLKNLVFGSYYISLDCLFDIYSSNINFFLQCLKRLNYENLFCKNWLLDNLEYTIILLNRDLAVCNKTKPNDI